MNLGSKIYISPWITIGSSILLMAVVAFLGVVNYHRDKERMGIHLKEKGATLIRSFEAGTRIGLRGTGFASEVDLNFLIEETAVQPDISHIAIVDRTGVILAHSIRKSVGNLFLPPDEFHALFPSNQVKWRIVKDKNGVNCFEVYKTFLPIRNPLDAMEGVIKKGEAGKNLLAPNREPLIFIGMDIAPFEQAMSEDLHHNIVMAAIILALGIAGVVSLFWAQSYSRSSKLVEELELKAQRVERLAAIGNLAAGIAHEVRNPLSSIKGYVTYFGSLFDKGSENQRAALLMAGEVDRVNRVISELLEFAKPSDLKFMKIKVGDLINHSIRIVSHEAESNGIEIVKKIDPRLPDPMVDLDRLTQVLLNFYINAIQAMEKGGRLVVQASYRKFYLVLEVSDTGAGIGKEDLKHIFEPYFTTKKSGTGLGLAIAHKIVESHGGSIQVKSAPGVGTWFSIFLPIKNEKEINA